MKFDAVEVEPRSLSSVLARPLGIEVVQEEAPPLVPAWTTFAHLAEFPVISV